MTKVFTWTLILIALLLTAEAGYSQSYNFSINSVNEGLPHVQIADVMEASDGFIRLAASGAGVSHFEGERFSNFDLQVRSGQGRWSEITFYEFSVEKPFWMEIWFWILMFFLLVLGLTGLFQFYTKRLENERLSSLVDERTAHLLQAVKDKETLVKEIHHRVKNNLAMIIGLLELQATRSTDEATINTLNDSILRIYSMSLVHEKLYSTDHLTNVDVKNYITDLINVIVHSMNLDQKNITIKKKINSIKLSLDQGITCGLLINELVINAIKHAFTDLDGGTICIEFEVMDKYNILTVTDDGIGFPKDFPGFENLHNLEGTSLGLTLITTLTNQMNGTLTSIPQERGSKIRITF